ncbi:lipase family protein [Falsirhodobacter sp. 20TX0035]|uniref:lipase family protein n=1 Tax=Falsirhodobacter sp. 20TX0035 TaxID=3022019 RepID=UPI00232C6A2C|nr:lipase family protein [Falsirhodobacter sp. 20TX0035]MDB6452989.1 lipase family protein [Falsirhodobacter sp. 20TX0035]
MSLRIACLVAAAAMQPAFARTLPTGPAVGDIDISPFYRWTEALPDAPGRMLRREPMAAETLPAHAANADRILYTSDDGHWDSGIIPVSGILYVPKGEAPEGGWPLVAWAHGTLGVNDACAASWTGARPRDADYIDRWLESGYAVVATDYQGLGGPGPHPYLVSAAEGRSVLDSARAAMTTDVPLADVVILTGQSQGSGASLGAARIAADYAPDLPVKGAIATALITYMPEPGVEVDREMPGGEPRYVLYRLIGEGLPEGGPIDALLTEKGAILADAVRTTCNQLEVTEREGITRDNAFTRPIAEVNALLPPAGQVEPFKVDMPLFLGTSPDDAVIRPERQMTAVRGLCDAGNTVVLRSYPGATHSDTLTRSGDDALAFAKMVVAGDMPVSDCATVD